MHKPTKEEIYNLYKQIKDKTGLQRKAVCELMSTSTGTSAETVDKWISGKRTCSAGYWRLLNIDFVIADKG